MRLTVAMAFLFLTGCNLACNDQGPVISREMVYLKVDVEYTSGTPYQGIFRASGYVTNDHDHYVYQVTLFYSGYSKLLCPELPPRGKFQFDTGEVWNYYPDLKCTGVR